MPDLSSCPFCSSELMQFKSYAQHPVADCILSGRCFGASDYRVWNKRSATYPGDGDNALAAALLYLRGHGPDAVSGGIRNGTLRNQIKAALLGNNGPLRAGAAASRPSPLRDLMSEEFVTVEIGRGSWQGPKSAAPGWPVDEIAAAPTGGQVRHAIMTGTLSSAQDDAWEGQE